MRSLIPMTGKIAIGTVGGTVADGENGLYGSPASLPAGTSQNTSYSRDVCFVAEDHD